MGNLAGKFQTIYSSTERTSVDSVIVFLKQAGFHPSGVKMNPRVPVPDCRTIYRVELPSGERGGAQEILAACGYESEPV
ncbi:MAG TPA: hypothetical protein VMB21_20080 [Candidatus Limnocylindria bacterium]|jgi:hypothetical protein|nr:hypothetical protein [Candidatus Limnocylindria bacterium]